MTATRWVVVAAVYHVSWITAMTALLLALAFTLAGDWAPMLASAVAAVVASGNARRITVAGRG